MPAEAFDTYSERLHDYIVEIHEANSEASKALSLLTLLRQTFSGIAADKALKLVPKLEKHLNVMAGTVLVRGRIDALLGNLVIELKMTLNEARLEEAKQQLRKYVSALWVIDKHRTNYMLMATDGLRFRVYKPSAPLTAEEASPKEISLEEVNVMDIESETPEDSFRWLDRYVLWRDRKQPTSEDMASDFGLASPAFLAAMDGLQGAWSRGRETASAPFAEWSKYLSVVYGMSVGDEALFLKHTYLAALAKLMVYAYYTSGAIPSKAEVRKVLGGEAFKEWGIENFLEEDFFSWLVRGEAEEQGTKLAWSLLQVLERYDMTKLTEDVLKGLYQGLVDPEARHDLGEYYTPDWLAEWIVDRLLEDPKLTTLDPACGSGTFLAAAIRKKVALLKTEPHLRLTLILNSVKGIDVHPLAVLISKANYLMALGDLVKYKAGPIHVPVYLANSIDFPTAKRDVEHGVEVYRYPISDHTSLVVPQHAVERGILAETIDAAASFARMVASGTIKQDPELFDKYVTAQVPVYTSLREGAKDALWDTCKTLARLIKTNKDTIYAFIVKNVYRPATLSKFDTVIGNPPWLPYRDIALPDYQKRLKAMIFEEHKLLAPRKTELITHMELATLFFARCCQHYLRDNGTIGFVMPYSIFTADQHDVFRRGTFLPSVEFLEIVDLEAVTPLFSFPASVVIAKMGGKPAPPKTALRMEGTLPEKNSRPETLAALQKEGRFVMREVPMSLVEIGERSAWTYGGEGPCGGRSLSPGPSPYMQLFREGATLVPHSAWWVEIRASPKLGVNPEQPFVETSKRALERAKKAYRGLVTSGSIERAYLYATLPGSDSLPFVHLPVRPVVLPVEHTAKGYVVLRRNQAEARGHQGLAKWLSKAEKEWTKRRGAKAEKMDIYERLDRGKGLTGQNPRTPYWLVYNKDGTHLSACVVTSKEMTVPVGDQTVSLQGFVAQDDTVFFQTDSRQEAEYLCSVFNSRVVDEAIKPIQARGLWGERHIQKKPLELAIPKFDPNNHAHRALVELAQRCGSSARNAMDKFIQARGGDVGLLSPQAIGQLRSKMRENLSAELDEIDALVCGILTLD